VQSEHYDFSKMNYLKSKKIDQENEEGKMMKKYKEELDGPKEDKTIKEEESSVDSDQEDSFYIKVNYFLQRENNVRLFNQFPLDNLNDPASTDRNTVNAKQIGIYSKCISAIKDLPKSPKRNVILADYRKIVSKYSNLANKILNSWAENGYSQELNVNMRIKKFKIEENIPFTFYDILTVKATFAIDFIFLLNDTFVFHGASFDELPIRYVLSSYTLEIYGIWFDTSLKDRLEEQWSLFRK
jgi:hypothetical protein